MSNTQELLDRQARWQRSRKSLSWPEKIRLAERVRESVLRLRRTGQPAPSGGDAVQRPPKPA